MNILKTAFPVVTIYITCVILAYPLYQSIHLSKYETHIDPISQLRGRPGDSPGPRAPFLGQKSFRRGPPGRHAVTYALLGGIKKAKAAGTRFRYEPSMNGFT